MKKSSVLPALAVTIAILTILWGPGCGNDHATGNAVQQTKIAFRSGRATGDITGQPFIMNRIDGSGVTPILYSGMPSIPRGVTISPDDSKMLAEIDGIQSTQIYISNLDGNTWTALTSSGSNRGPRWSPNGKQIVFYSNREGNPGPWKIYLMNVDGSNQTRVSPLDDMIYDTSPSFSPDGTQIVFLRRDNTKHESGIWIMNGDGSSSKPVIVLSTVAYTPAFSPDGKKILWIENNEIASGNLDGSGKTTLTNSGSTIYELIVVGTEVWFTSSQNGNLEVYKLDSFYKMSAGTPLQKNMTNDPHADSIDMYVP